MRFNAKLRPRRMMQTTRATGRHPERGWFIRVLKLEDAPRCGKGDVRICRPAIRMASLHPSDATEAHDPMPRMRKGRGIRRGTGGPLLLAALQADRPRQMAR